MLAAVVIVLNGRKPGLLSWNANGTRVRVHREVCEGGGALWGPGGQAKTPRDIFEGPPEPSSRTGVYTHA